MKSKNNKLVGREHILPIVLTILFISPAIFIKTGPRFFYFILAGAIGWAIGKYIILSLKEQKAKSKEKRIFLRELAIWIYFVLYLIIALFVDYNLLNKEFILDFLLKNVFIGGFMFLQGLFGIQTKKAWLGGFPLTKKASVIYAIIAVLFSLIILFARPLISIFGGMS